MGYNYNGLSSQYGPRYNSIDISSTSIDAKVITTPGTNSNSNSKAISFNGTKLYPYSYNSAGNLDGASEISIDLGDSNHLFKDLYLKGNLTDGTNSISIANIANSSNYTYQTTAPSAAISDGGIHIVYLSAEPATKYSGYIYMIAES